MKFIQLAKSIKEDGLAPIYLIEGEEAYFREHAVEAIRAACALTMPQLNDLRLEGETLKGDELKKLPARLMTFPFMDEKRLIRIYEFYPTEKEWESVLSPYAAAPCKESVLLLINAGSKKGADLKRKKGVVYVDCGKETEEALARWVFGMAKRAQLSIDGDAANLLVRYCNQDAARMKIEIEKLSLLLGHGGRITRETVENYIAKDVEYKIYELTQAASRGNSASFFTILSDLMEKGFDENAALSALLSHYRTLMEISDMKGTDAQIGAALSIKPYAVQKNREAARRLGAERVRAIYLALYALSADMRSGLVGKSGALSAAIAKIFFG